MATSATTSAGATAQSRKNRHGENPVALFEQRAKEILASSVAGEQKVKRLMELSKAISTYVARLNVHLASASVDNWSAMTANRCRIYLSQLGDDVRKLASTARSKSADLPLICTKGQSPKDSFVQTQRGNS